ncbi:MAG: sulfatase [Anaerolineales bacterium]
MTQKANIVWVLVDSVRSYPSETDGFGKLPAMERFGESSTEFTNVVTSAPSTIMSISAMMTSTPSYLIARNYDDFFFDKSYFLSLNDLLKEHGYFAMAFLRDTVKREKFRNLFDLAPRRFWEPHLRHGQRWTNAELIAVLRNALSHGIPRPAFLFVHLTTRLGGHPSVDLDETLELLTTAGFGTEETIYIVCSDHGFPDSDRGFDIEELAKPRRSQDLTHDMTLTDDNIKIPLYMKYPGCIPTRIDEMVSSLDILPTVLDLAGITLEEDIRRQFRGTSLVPLLENRPMDLPKYLRSDARLLYQSNRITSIRSQQYKLVRNHDDPPDSRDVFYDLIADPGEKTNLADDPGDAVESELARFRAEFDRQENAAIEFQARYLLSRFRQRLGDEQDPTSVLALIQPNTAFYEEMMLRVMRGAWPNARVDLLADKGQRSSAAGYDEVFSYALDPNSDEHSLIGDRPDMRYDLLLLSTLNPSAPEMADLLKLSRQFRARRALVLDCNMDAYQRRRFWYYRLRAGLALLSQVIEEPGLVFDAVRLAGEVLSRRLFAGTRRSTTGRGG